jgi:V/A-type H+-transporting ATPase subunit F
MTGSFRIKAASLFFIVLLITIAFQPAVAGTNTAVDTLPADTLAGLLIPEGSGAGSESGTVMDAVFPAGKGIHAFSSVAQKAKTATGWPGSTRRQVVEVKENDSAADILASLLYRDDTGIVAVNEEYMTSLDEKLIARIEKTYRPIIIPIPVGMQRLDRTGYMERLLQRAIGYNIVIRR